MGLSYVYRVKLRVKRQNVGQNTITINGKLYDAKTGKLLGSAVAPKKPVAAPQTTASTGAALDGFSKRRSAPASRPTPATSVHAKTAKSQTLRRDAVSKPKKHEIHAKAAPHTTHKSASHSASTTYNQPNPDRLARAASATKSKFISRFGAPVTTTERAVSDTKPVKKIAPVPVATAPPITAAATTNQFDKAVAQASSHSQPIHKTKTTRRQRVAHKLRLSPRTVSFASLALAVILFGGFFVYQNIPTMAMRMASARSGVNATMPGYKAAGFTVNGPITYSAGKITIKYKSTTDDRNYQVSQSNSQWNDEALVDNFVAVERRPYQTYQDKGKTIYIYDGSNATWIENGVWYQVEGGTALSSDQLLRIANSM